MPAQPGLVAQIYTTTSSYHVLNETRLSYEGWLKDKYRRFAEGVMKDDNRVLSFTVTCLIYGSVKELEATE